jgi:hypothetical protein
MAPEELIKYSDNVQRVQDCLTWLLLKGIRNSRMGIERRKGSASQSVGQKLVERRRTRGHALMSGTENGARVASKEWMRNISLNMCCIHRTMVRSVYKIYI